MTAKTEKGLDIYLEQTVSVVTNDGRNIVVSFFSLPLPLPPSSFFKVRVQGILRRFRGR